MKQLKYQVEDRTIAHLLGIQNFTNDESAVLELVKNAYDAGATHLSLDFSNQKLIITDNGKGMNEEDIYSCWMNVGKSSKGYSAEDLNNQQRVLAGSKGIGRFALARLGRHVVLTSKKKSFNAIRWETDWNTSTLEIDSFIETEGTQIVISELRENWNKKKVDNLVDFLSITYNDCALAIKIIHSGVIKVVQRRYQEPILGINCLSIIRIKYDSKDTSLTTSVESDEFDSRAQELCPNIDLKHFTSTKNMIIELEGSSTHALSRIELESALHQLGDFQAELYFSIAPGIQEQQKFFYKRPRLSDPYPSGIVLYRNAFSISSMEGKKDWLGLGRRARKSPAAATHPTGSWRVRENQLAGKVLIDKTRNEKLEDLSNRQGLNENVFYTLFVDIIHTSLLQFERYRQSIIRKVNLKNETETQHEDILLASVAKGELKLSSLTYPQQTLFVTQLQDQFKQISFLHSRFEEQEIRYRYEIRLLNLLATMGLKSYSAAHEFKNYRNNLNTNIEDIRSALQEYGMWESLCSKEKTRYAYKNVPYLLDSNQTINEYITRFMNAMLAKIEKQKFNVNTLNVEEVLQSLCRAWEDDYAFVKIELDIESELNFKTSEDVCSVIFDNLILNSIQQNGKLEQLVISISIRKQDSYLLCTYHDNGVGLSTKYRNEPFLILEVHESSRKDGHGLGMWIINNTCKSTGGEILSITGVSGFSIDFLIGDKLS